MVLNHHPEFYIKHLVNHKNTTELFHDNTVNNRQHRYKSASGISIFLGLTFPTWKTLNLPNTSPGCWLASDTITSCRENKFRINMCGRTISMSGSNYNQSTLYFSDCQVNMSWNIFNTAVLLSSKCVSSTQVIGRIGQLDFDHNSKSVVLSSGPLLSGRIAWSKECSV